MAKIRHIALSTPDPDKTAKFYVDVFGMKQIGRVDNPNVSGYYLTDGDINLAVLNFKNDAVAGAERGKDYFGIHHFGFQVESLEAITERDWDELIAVNLKSVFLATQAVLPAMRANRWGGS